MKRIIIAVVCLCLAQSCLAQEASRHQRSKAYPEQDATAVWRSLGASYVRRAINNNQLDRDPHWNARVDLVMSKVGNSAGRLFPRFSAATWCALLIDHLGHGAVAFPGGTVLVDAGFVRRLGVSDDELALILSHEIAHVVAGHPSEKLDFVAEKAGKESAPDAGAALLAFYTHESYSRLFQPTALVQEREADQVGAAILAESGYDEQAALRIFDKLGDFDSVESGSESSSHDPSATRRAAFERVFEGLRGPRGESPIPAR